MPAKKSEKKQDDIAKEMGRRLKRERKAVQLSQAALAKELAQIAERLGREAPKEKAIGMYENGKRRIRHERAQLLELKFGKPAAYFLCELTESEADVIVAMRKGAARNET